MPLTPAQRAALLAQTSCGIKELRDFLETEIDFIAECQPENCFPQLRYMYIQLALIEAAQIFARNRIDTAARVAVGQMHERFTAFEDRRTDMERTATGRACAWQAATSAQNFHRDSTDSTVGFSESDELRTAERLENGYDRSYRTTYGHGAHFSRTIHTVEARDGDAMGLGLGMELARAGRTSTTDGGTDPLIPLFGTNAGGVTFDTTFPFVHIGGVENYLPVSFPPSSDAICPPVTLLDPHPVCPVPGYPSYGNGYNYGIKVTVSLAVPGVGGLNVEAVYNEGRNERQYYHCSTSSVAGTSTINGRDDAISVARTIARPWENFTWSGENHVNVHLVRKFGSSTRRGTGSLDAEEVELGRAEGEAHAESNRDSKQQAYQQSRAEHLTTRHIEDHLRHSESVRDNYRSDKFGQIPMQLKQLWDRVWVRVNELERASAAVPAAGAMACQPVRVGFCCPPRVPWRGHAA